MRSKSDPISLLKDRMLSNNMAAVEEFKVSARNTHQQRIHAAACSESVFLKDTSVTRTGVILSTAALCLQSPVESDYPTFLLPKVKVNSS